MDAGWIEIDRTLPAPEAALQALLQRGLINERDVERAAGIAQSSGRSILTALNQAGALRDAALTSILSDVTGLDILDPVPGQSADPDTAINPEFLRDRQALMVSASGPLAVTDPFDDRLLQGIEFALGYLPALVLIRPGDWARGFDAFHSVTSPVLPVDQSVDDALLSDIADQERDAPIVKQVSLWISAAADAGASDIHFDARRTTLDVQYRIDGILKTIAREPKAIAASVVARIKVIADLDLGERNKAQDGRATVTVRGRRIDIRVSIIPTIDGEGAVIRLLDRPEGLLSLSSLGFSPDVVSALERASDRRHGMFIVAGPTGSGKTTTLYSCLERMKGRGLKILSIEDPVEYHFDHVNQVQISEKAGRTFSGTLRSFLRHDPDVIMVGEIRDSETAQVAVQAALSGHLVLATLHAIDTVRVRTRLSDMGVEPFKIDACLVGSLAQRLVRLLCSDCAEPAPISTSHMDLFSRHGFAYPPHTYHPGGCAGCGHEGYRGRIALAELAEAGDQPLAASTLIGQALHLVYQGRTSIAEIMGLSGP